MFNLPDLIRSVPDYPITGMIYRDMNPLLRNPAAFQQVVDALVMRYKDRAIDAIVGVESRGFIISSPLAYQLGVSLVPRWPATVSGTDVRSIVVQPDLPWVLSVGISTARTSSAAAQALLDLIPAHTQPLPRSPAMPVLGQ
jgi:adenine/guanine phosphoribosyltransferase-like PRPP-binding protein